MEKEIKLANDTASIIFCALNDAKEGKNDWEGFTKALYQNFPKEVADHVYHLVSSYLLTKPSPYAGLGSNSKTVLRTNPK